VVERAQRRARDDEERQIEACSEVGHVHRVGERHREAAGAFHDHAARVRLAEGVVGAREGVQFDGALRAARGHERGQRLAVDEGGDVLLHFGRGARGLGQQRRVARERVRRAAPARFGGLHHADLLAALGKEARQPGGHDGLTDARVGAGDEEALVGGARVDGGRCQLR
jgi:hypothetical protein